MISSNKLFIFGLAVWLAARPFAGATDALRLGPMFDEFDLTLSLGHRTEMLGPLFYSEETESAKLWALPPLLSVTRDAALDTAEVDFAYPVITYRRYGTESRWHFMQVLSFANSQDQSETNTHRFTVYPLYFRQRSGNTNDNYTAFFPFYGHVRHRLFKDDIFAVMFPFYGRTRKGEVETENYLYPFFHLRHGPGLNGWQVWPLTGHEHKEPTTRTNDYGDAELISGHDYRFVVWPIYANDRDGLGTTNIQTQQALLPLFSLVRSPSRDSTTIGWPFFTHVTDREKQYKEWQLPWPLIVFARGEGKTTSRVWPIYSRAQTTNLESMFCPWLIYKYNRVRVGTLERSRTRIGLYFYSDVTERNTETGTCFNRRDLWPLFTWRRELNGNTRLQILAPLEPILPNNRSVDRDYSPMWSLWRSESNPRTARASQSLLWNFYRSDTTPAAKKVSLLFGLFQYESGAAGKFVSLCHLPVVNAPFAEYTP